MVRPPDRAAAEAECEALFRAHKDGLLAAAMVVDPHLAWDGVQQAFEEALTRMLAPHAPPVRNWWGWLRQVTIRHVVARRQEVAAHASAEGLDGIDPAPLTEDLVVIKEKFEGTLRQVAALPLRQRHAVGLRFLGGFSYPEIARIMAVEEVTVRNLISQARRSLKADRGRL